MKRLSATGELRKPAIALVICSHTNCTIHRGSMGERISRLCCWALNSSALLIYRADVAVMVKVSERTGTFICDQIDDSIEGRLNISQKTRGEVFKEISW